MGGPIFLLHRVSRFIQPSCLYRLSISRAQTVWLWRRCSQRPWKRLDLCNVPGFNKEVEEKLHKAANWFFSLPLDEKLHLSPKNWNPDAEGVYRGYVPISEADNHLREQYEMGEILPGDDPDRKSGNPIYEPTPLPREENVPFRDLVYAHYYAMANAGMEFLRLLAIGMGLDEHHLTKDSCQNLSPLYESCITLHISQRVNLHSHVKSILTQCLSLCSSPSIIQA